MNGLHCTVLFVWYVSSVEVHPNYLGRLHFIWSELKNHLSPLARENHASLSNATPRRVKVPLTLPAEVIAHAGGVHHVEP